MARFKIFETEGFSKDLSEDFKGRQVKIKKKLFDYVYPQLRDNPYFGTNIKKLVNYKPETWRYRIGAYRFFYQIDEKNKLVILISADNRQDAY